MKIKGYIGSELVAEGLLGASQGKGPTYQLDLSNVIRNDNLTFLQKYDFVSEMKKLQVNNSKIKEIMTKL